MQTQSEKKEQIQLTLESRKSAPKNDSLIVAAAP
jgi:hypothetical protein